MVIFMSKLTLKRNISTSDAQNILFKGINKGIYTKKIKKDNFKFEEFYLPCYIIKAKAMLNYTCSLGGGG